MSHVWVCKTIDFTRRRSHVSQQMIRFGEIFRSEFESMNLVYVKNENFLVVLPVDFHNLWRRCSKSVVSECYYYTCVLEEGNWKGVG